MDGVRKKVLSCRCGASHYLYIESIPGQISLPSGVTSIAKGIDPDNGRCARRRCCALEWCIAYIELVPVGTACRMAAGGWSEDETVIYHTNT